MDYIQTDKAPSAVGPYSQAVSVENFIFTSGQIGLNERGVLVEGGVEMQAKQVLKNLGEVIKAGDTTLQNIVKTTIFLINMEDFAEVNKIYADFFGKHKPARSTIAVKELPLGALIEIEAVAIKSKN